MGIQYGPAFSGLTATHTAAGEVDTVFAELRRRYRVEIKQLEKLMARKEKQDELAKLKRRAAGDLTAEEKAEFKEQEEDKEQEEQQQQQQQGGGAGAQPGASKTASRAAKK